MSARDNILRRIRSRQGKSEFAAAEETDAVRSHIRAHLPGPRPRVAGDLRAAFRGRAIALASSVDEVGSMADAPRAIADWLAGKRLPTAAVCWPELSSLAWEEAGLRVEPRPAREGDLTGITGAYCAIAETGTLMLLSGARTPAVTSLLPETHIAIVRVARIVPGMEDAWQLLREEHGAPPRAVSFVSGPSRTADIEQTVSLGAHGPYRVHIVLVSG